MTVNYAYVVRGLGPSQSIIITEYLVSGKNEYPYRTGFAA